PELRGQDANALAAPLDGRYDVSHCGRDERMKRLWGVVPLGIFMMIGSWGCATSPLPPSESTMSIVRSYQDQLSARVSSGHLTPAQARELFYAKLVEIQPPLPGLDELQMFRNQVMAQVEAKTLTPEQAEARLAARESEMLAR